MATRIDVVRNRTAKRRLRVRGGERELCCGTVPKMTKNRVLGAPLIIGRTSYCTVLYSYMPTTVDEALLVHKGYTFSATITVLLIQASEKNIYANIHWST
jgi:hypothetical protein